MLNSASYSSRLPNDRWGAEDTEQFYKVRLTLTLPCRRAARCARRLLRRRSAPARGPVEWGGAVGWVGRSCNAVCCWRLPAPTGEEEYALAHRRSAVIRLCKRRPERRRGIRPAVTGAGCPSSTARARARRRCSCSAPTGSCWSASCPGARAARSGTSSARSSAASRRAWMPRSPARRPAWRTTAKSSASCRRARGPPRAPPASTRACARARVRGGRRHGAP